jgi:hypothetical protein
MPPLVYLNGGKYFSKFILSPEAHQKSSSNDLITNNSSRDSFDMIRISSTKIRWRILITLDTFTPDKTPSDCLFFSRRLILSITKMNNRGESGHPCLRPRSLWKKVEVSPFIRTTKEELTTQLMIQFMEVRLKPILMRIKQIKSQFTQS